MHQRHEEQRRVENVGAVVLHEGLSLLAPALGHDPREDRVTLGCPATEIRGERAVGRDADGAVERDPAHEPRVGEVLSTAADFPDALVGLMPVVAEPVEVAGDLLPVVVGHELPVAGQCELLVEVDRVDELAVDVELQLAGGSVSDADRTGTGVALEVIEGLFGDAGVAVHPVQRPQRRDVSRVAVVFRQRAGEPVDQERLSCEAES